MQTYRYTAISDKGARVTGVVEAQDEYAAVSKIRLNYPIIEKISEVKPAKQSFLNKDIGTVKIDEKALSVMCSQFSTILQAGVDISSAMGMIAQQTQDKRLRAMLESSAKDVAGGSSIASSMQKNLPQLPLTFIETIRAGEQSGTLEDSFATMQKYYEKEQYDEVTDWYMTDEEKMEADKGSVFDMLDADMMPYVKLENVSISGSTITVQTGVTDLSTVSTFLKALQNDSRNGYVTVTTAAASGDETGNLVTASVVITWATSSEGGNQ